MNTVLGIVCLLFGLLGWGGQFLSAVSFETAQRLGLQEPSGHSDPLYQAAERKAAQWDSLCLWTLPLVGLLLLLRHPWWPPVAILAGGIHIDAGGREAAKWLALRAAGIKVGASRDLGKAAGAFILLIIIGLWCAAAGMMAVLK